MKYKWWFVLAAVALAASIMTACDAIGTSPGNSALVSGNNALSNAISSYQTSPGGTSPGGTSPGVTSPSVSIASSIGTNSK